MFKCKVTSDFEWGGKDIKQGSIILVSGWMMSGSFVGKHVRPIKWVKVAHGFNCSLKTASVLREEKERRASFLKKKIREIEAKYNWAISNLES